MALIDSTLESIPLLFKGKVRDIYKISDKKILIVTTDRISAFDQVLPTGLPDKGIILTEVTKFWMNKFGKIVDNHLLANDYENLLTESEIRQVKGRSVVAKYLKPIPIEAVVRDHLDGSAWSEYNKFGKVCGISLPPGLKKREKLSNPIFTPALKAEKGKHDKNISFVEAEEIVGSETIKQIKNISLKLFLEASKFLLEKKFILLDTKFEFALDGKNLILIDEVLTPDSSRFLFEESDVNYSTNLKYFDKQIIRDYLETNKLKENISKHILPSFIVIKAASAYRFFSKRILNKSYPKVSVVMGSESDLKIMQHCIKTLEKFSIDHEVRVISAHRTPNYLFEFAEDVHARGIKIIIAGAGGAAHLPGMLASKTIIPVFGVPVTSQYLNGEDSLYSIVQMPKGVPVATFAIGEAGAVNSALEAIAILSLNDLKIQKKLEDFRLTQKEKVIKMDKGINNN